MAGKKGRSGRISTQAQARARSEAGVKGAATRWGELRRDADPPPQLTPEQQSAASEAAPGLARPVSWREAWQQQQAGNAALKRRLLKLQVETMERERIPLPEVREFLGKFRALVFREFASLPALADELPEGRPHQIDWLRERLIAFITTLRTNVSKEDIA